MAVLWTSSSCFFPSRFPSLLRVTFFVLPSTVHTDCMPCCPYVVCRIVVILRISWYWAYWWYCRMDVTWCGCIDVMTATQLLSNTTSFPHETLEPRDIGTPSRSTGTLEPRDIGTPSAQGGERAPTREPGMGTDPRNGIFQVSPRASSAVSPLPGSWPSRSWRLRRPG